MDESDHASNQSQKTANNGLYLPPSWQMLKKQIAYLAQFGGSIQVVQGKLGAGKTTLLTWLVEEPIAGDFIALSAAPQLVISDFLYELLWQLGLRPERDAPIGEYIASLRSYVESLRIDGERVVVAIDDAHFIPSGSLAAIVSVLQGGDESGFGLHLIFFSDFGLVEKLDAMQLLDIEVHDVEVPSLSLPQTEQLLYASGLSVSRVIPAEEIKQMWYQSGGLPGLILAAYHARSESPRGSSPAESAKASVDRAAGFPYGHIAAVLLLVGVLFWALLVREEPQMPISESPMAGIAYASSSVSSAAGNAPKVTASVATRSNDQADLAEESPPAVNSGTLVAAPSSSPHEAVAAGVGLARADETSSAATTVEGALLSAENNRTQTPAQKTAQAQKSGAKFDTDSTADNDLAANSTTSTVESTADGAADPARSRPTEVALPKENQVTQVDKTADQKHQSPLEQASSGTDSAASSAPKSADLAATKRAATKRSESQGAKHIRDSLDIADAEAMLKDYSSNAYLLQLMALSNYEKLRSYALEQPNKEHLKIYRAKRNGKTYYILLEGYYADKSSAEAAIANLPAWQRRGKPWPKSVASIQQDLQ